MEKIETFEQYKDLLKSVRSICRMPFSNNYFTADNIQRFIELERAYYHATPNGMIFLFDEERYYRACLYLDDKQDFCFPRLDKKILIRNVYRAERKPNGMLEIDKRLIDQGFEKKDTTVQINGYVKEILERCARMEKYAKKMESVGFRCIEAKEEQLGEMEELLLRSGLLRDYHVDYRTVEECQKMPGTYLGIVDAEGNLCAMNTVEVAHGIAQGVGIAIDDKYKMHGLAPILTYHRFRWLKNNGIEQIQGWILLNNEKSLQYHASLGYEITDKFADEWIKDVD